MLVPIITTVMFLVLVSSSSTSILSLQYQQAHATAFGLGDSRVPPAYIIVDGFSSRLQLDNRPFSDGIADYGRPVQGTISFGERFSLLIPQFSGFYKDVQSAKLTVCSDDSCSNDDFHIHQELVNVKDTRVGHIQTHVLDAPSGLGDGFTASDVGFKIFMWWTVSFTDGTEQSYLAIVYLQGDPCEEHGWVYTGRGTKCADPNF